MKLTINFSQLAVATVYQIIIATTVSAQCTYDIKLSTVIRDSLKAYVEKGKISGAVTLVAKDNCIISFEAIGYQDLNTKTPMQRNTIFQVRSMTKTITAAGIMLLVDDGKIKLKDPISKYLPEFKSIRHVNRDSTHLTAHRGTITIKHLLSHTSGLPDEIPTDVRKQFTKPIKSLADVVAIAAKIPLLFYPGTEYNYSGIGYYVLGRLIEVASGMSYEKFVSEQLFKPLNMKDSYVLLPDVAKERIATAYEVKDSKLQLSPAYDYSFMSWLTFPRPSWSMFSTANDLLSFYQMLLQGGSYRGKRILSAKSVTLMTSAQVKNILNRQGFGYGFGVYISLAPTDATSALSFESYGHGGLLGTNGWVDPEWNMIRIFLIQRLPSSPAEAFLGQEREIFMKLATLALARH